MARGSFQTKRCSFTIKKKEAPHCLTAAGDSEALRVSLPAAYLALSPQHPPPKKTSKEAEGDGVWKSR